MNTEEFLVLVDPDDRPIGTMEKLAAHEQGLLHRAFSLFVFNSKNELLLQQRAEGKYHSGGLWTNTCCSHPRPDEKIELAVRRRLDEEMGMNCEFSQVFSFIYKADFGNGLTEHELDHVFFGWTDELPEPNMDEVFSYRYADFENIERELENDPEQYTVWFRACFEQVKKHLAALAKAS